MQSKFIQSQYFLVLSIFELFSVNIYALSPIEAGSITIKNDNQVMIEPQAETLKWIRELKNSLLQSTEPYLGTAQELQAEAALKTKDFQCGCAAPQNYFSSINSQEKTDIVKALSLMPVNSQSSTAIYVFVSLSMPKPALMALNKEAAQLGAPLVLRGLKDNSYQKTAFYLQDIIEKTGQGFLIHPELFKRYEIHQVPSVVLATDTLSAEPIFDVVSGHIPIKTALLEMAQKGELKNEAKDWLQRGGYAD